MIQSHARVSKWVSSSRYISNDLCLEDFRIRRLQDEKFPGLMDILDKDLILHMIRYWEFISGRNKEFMTPETELPNHYGFSNKSRSKSPTVNLDQEPLWRDGSFLSLPWRAHHSDEKGYRGGDLDSWGIGLTIWMADRAVTQDHEYHKVDAKLNHG